ncbi:hypothetical protein FBU31_004397, partial [Coemansia sp. 'formosensis']
MPDKRRKKNLPKPQLPDTEPNVSQIENEQVTNAVVPAMASQDTPVVPAVRPAIAPS